MDIVRLSAADPALTAAAYEMSRLARQHDHPALPARCRQMFEVDVATGGGYDQVMECYAARQDGRVVGLLTVNHGTVDNPTFAGFHAVVDPQYRRRGVGTALLELATERGRADGRDTQTSFAAAAIDGGPPISDAGRQFLLASGFDQAHSSVKRSLKLAELDETDEQSVLDEAWGRADGYELVQWVGTTPDDAIDGAARLWSRMVSDVPWGELDVSGWQFDTDRIRSDDAKYAERGLTMLNSYVRHVDSGEMVAHSVIAVPATVPEFAQQWITLVRPDHRGHRLGVIVKIENSRLLQRTCPATRYIETTNAESNTHMVAINDRLGFTPLARSFDFQRRI